MPRILIIEDEPDFLRIYSDLLRSRGYEVLTANDGQVGLTTVFEQKPDLVLLDLVLPSLPGLEILTAIRNNSEVAATPVIIFSVLGDKDDVQRGLAAGANDYAVKGFYRPAEIIQKIESALAKSDVKNSLTTYKIGLLPNHLDYILLAQELGLTQGFICPACRTPLVMELTPDVTRETGHWYFSHFVCPQCQTKI